MPKKEIQAASPTPPEKTVEVTDTMPKDRNAPADKDRTFLCTRTCYWNGTRYYGGPEVLASVREPDRIVIPAGMPIPANFQWDNWEDVT